ncbi:MAG: Prokaryotic lipoprotein-attachment site [Pseudomonadota bacterium]|jgi:predicted small lipoprotein YifL
MKIFILLSTLFLLNCGQTGPLYLPDSPPPIHVEKNKPATPEISPSQFR